MKTLDSCFACGGFIPSAATQCPHCQTKTQARQPRHGLSPAFARATKIALGTLGGGVTALTLMACYGAPCTTATTTCRDLDLEDAHTAADAQIGDNDAGIRDGSVQDARDTDTGDAGATDAATDAPTDSGSDAK